MTPSPRPDGVRPSFWEETSPRELARTERNLCLSPPSDSASPSDVEFGGLAFKGAEKSHWNGSLDFLQSSTEAAQRTNHEISQRHALDRAMNLVLERAAHRPDGLAEGELGRLPPSSSVDSHGRTERVLQPAPNNSNGQNVFHPAEAGARGQGAPLADTAGPPHAPAPAQSFVQTGAPVAYHAGGFPGSYVGGLPVGGQYALVMVYGAPSYGVPHGGMNPAGLVYAPPPPAAGSAGALAGRGSQEAPEGVARSRVAPQGPDSDALNARPDGHIKGAPGGSTGVSVPTPAQTITQPRIPATGSPRGKKTSQVGAGAAAVDGVGGKDRGRASGPTTEAKPVAPTRTALTVAPGDELHRGSAAGKAQAESSDSDDFDENDFDLVSPVAGRSLTSHSVPGLRVTSRVPLAPTELHGPRPKPRSPKSQASPPPALPASSLPRRRRLPRPLASTGSAAKPPRSLSRCLVCATSSQHYQTTSGRAQKRRQDKSPPPSERRRRRRLLRQPNTGLHLRPLSRALLEHPSSSADLTMQPVPTRQERPHNRLSRKAPASGRAPRRPQPGRNRRASPSRTSACCSPTSVTGATPRRGRL